MLGFFEELDTLVLGVKSESLHRRGKKDSSSLVRPRTKESVSRSMISKPSPSREGGLVANLPSHFSDSTTHFRLAVPFIPELCIHDDLAKSIPPSALASPLNLVPTNAFIAEQQWLQFTSPSLRPALRTRPKTKSCTATVSFGPSLHYHPTHQLEPSHRYLSI